MQAIFGNLPEAATQKLALRTPRLRWLHLAARAAGKCIVQCPWPCVCWQKILHGSSPFLHVLQVKH